MTPLALKPAVSENVLLVDGITRSGKNLVCKVVSHFDKVDYFHYFSIIENTIGLLHLGLIDKQTAARFLQINIDEIIYYRVIGRHMNTRTDDMSCVLNAPDPEEYIKRLAIPPGHETLKSFNARGRISLFHTHSVLMHADVLFSGLPYVKLVHVTRHPVDIAEAWLRRGWGERWGADSLAFSLIAESRAGVVPWYADGWADEYSAMTPAERCVESVCRLQAADLKTLRELDSLWKRQIFQFPLEQLIVSPAAVISALGDFLGTTPHKKIDALLKAERCPSDLPIAARKEKLDKLKAQAAQEFIERLRDASTAYERRWGLARLF